MPMFETPRGTRIVIHLPPTDWDEFNTAAKAYRDLVTEHNLTSRRVGALENDRQRAEEQDKLALARAIREGKPDPGNKKVEQIEKERDACRRRTEALEIALDEAETELLDVVDRNREEWVEQIRGEVLEAQSEYAEAVEVLARARAKVSAKFALLFFFQGFPEEQASYRVRGSFVAKLRDSLRDEPLRFDQVVEALREDAKPAFQPVEQAEEAQHASPLQSARKG